MRVSFVGAGAGAAGWAPSCESAFFAARLVRDGRRIVGCRHEDLHGLLGGDGTRAVEITADRASPAAVAAMGRRVAACDGILRARSDAFGVAAAAVPGTGHLTRDEAVALAFRELRASADLCRAYLSSIDPDDAVAMDAALAAASVARVAADFGVATPTALQA